MNTLRSIAFLSLLVVMGSCKDENVAITGICPVVLSTTPPNLASGVDLGTTIIVTFNESMNPLTIKDNTFSLTYETNTAGTAAVITGVLTYDAPTNSMRFDPTNPLPVNSLFTGRVEPWVKDLMGNALQEPYIWTFTTGVQPVVTAVTPLDLAVDVPIATNITATFNIPMTSATLNGTSFTVMNGTTPVPGVVTYTAPTVTFNPTVDLLEGVTYSVMLHNTIKSALGVPLMTPYVWSFTTVSPPVPTVISTNPLNQATGVALASNVVATFSEDMAPATLTTSSFTLKQGLTTVLGAVTLVDSVATFNPTATLLPGLVYTATITAAASNLAGTALAADYVWSFTTVESPTPTVISTNPLNQATGVALASNVVATFSADMDPATLTTSSFTVRQGLTTVLGTVTLVGSVATFNPTVNLTPGMTYTATITTAARNPSGIALASNYVWTFTTAETPAPTVISTNPVNQATGVALASNVVATFSEDMDQATLTTSSFTVKQGLTTVLGTVTLVGSVATFNPTVNLTPGLIYTATITNAARNLAGIALATNYAWTFTTVESPAPTVILTNPLNQATGVALASNVVATFSVDMDQATLTTSSFTVKQGLTTVLGTVTLVGSVATFNPTVNLTPGLIYTATITNAARNLAGIALTADYVWTFTTVESPAPTVILTNPLNQATGVALASNVVATFSVDMDQATLTTSSFTVKQGLTTVLGTVTLVGSVATFNPTVNLTPGMTYTATITTGARNLAGIALTADYVWTFETQQGVAPTVISTNPLNQATGVALNSDVFAAFSTDMDPTTLTTSSFTLKQGLTTVSGTVTLVGSEVTFNPTDNLAPGLTYTATITNAVRNLAGTAMLANYVWTFETMQGVAPTVISTNPVDLETGVALNTAVTVLFSQSMDATTLTNMSFTLKRGTTSVAGMVNTVGATSTFTPNSNLVSGATYTATITVAAKNSQNVALENEYVWSFNTAAPLGPMTVNLNSVEAYGIIAGVGVRNNAGFSVINDMNVGISPGVRSSITGFPPAVVVNGSIHASDDLLPAGIAAVLLAAKQHLVEAYLFAEGATFPAPQTADVDQGGLTLAPGIYKASTSLLIQNGDLTLDAQGDANAVWIFQIGSTLTTVGGAGGNIILAGGAQAKNIFWQVGSSATIGDNTIFKGNVLALSDITMNSNAVAEGRMLARNGSVVMTSTNTITKP